jgi:branched-chain amino acid transport system permease protein
VVGGLAVGVIEQLSAGMLSSKYKDAVAFLVILLTLFVLPNGLFGRSRAERV